MSKVKQVLMMLFVGAMAVSCSNGDNNDNGKPKEATEAQSLLTAFAGYGGTPYNAKSPTTYPAEADVSLKSVYGVSYKLRNYTTNPAGPIATFPLYKGIDPDGGVVDYIITEASDKEFAETIGVSYTPRMANALPEGRQEVTIKDGIISFKGKVDFSAKRSVTPGNSNQLPLTSFPPAAVAPGAVADAEWSGFCRLPSGVVINAQVMSNKTGIHDRIPHHGSIGEDNQNNPYLDKVKRRVSLQLLDGWSGGKRFFYHIVTESNDAGPAAIELGYYAPRLSKLAVFGQFPEGCFLGFSPNANGPDVLGVNNQSNITLSQGLNVGAKNNQQVDPVNCFPFGPKNLNYSPMWDAHISQWTLNAVNANKVRIITGIDDLASLVASGDVTNFVGNPATGPVSKLIAGLKPSGLLINCPAISQPEQSAIGNEYGTVLKP